MTKTINVMAPLVVGDPAGPNGEASKQAWQEFYRQLVKAKNRGANAVSTDVWWGLIETSERQYDWAYYDKLSNLIVKAGLKWVPIISLHQCGGNIGDTVNVALPEWVWTKVAANAFGLDRTEVGPSHITAVKYVSEQGNASSEFVSCWATDFVLEDYKAFFAEFQNHFADKKQHIAEINISLGPAGELRYPSYNSHDKGTDYPTRGALQCYSELARQSFVDFVLGKYGTVDGTRTAWGSLDKIEPPYDVNAFFEHRDHINTQYGRDLFDWYTSSLLLHGRKVMTAALGIFSSEGAAFAGIDLGAKVPGVHWRMGHWENQQVVFSDRLAEINAGLIPTSSVTNDASTGYGYQGIVTLIHELQGVQAGSRVVLHFTCLEMANGENESLAFHLVRWVGEEAKRQGVPIKGENALNYTLYDADAWTRMRSALDLYEGLTILRITDVIGTNKTARNEFRATTRLVACGVGVQEAAA